MKRIFDVVLTIFYLLAASLRFVPRKANGSARDFLMVDTSYDLAGLQARGALSVITSRDLDGFFDRVCYAHPLVGASPLHRADAFGPPRTVDLTNKHSVIEGHVAMTRDGDRFPTLGFARAQIAFLRTVDGLVRQTGVALIQASDPLYTGLLGWVLARRYRVPFVIRVSGNYDEMYRNIGRVAYPRLIPSRRAEVWLSRAMLKRAALIFPANGNNMDYAVANGADPDRCVVIPAYGDVLDPVHLEEPEIRTPPGDLPSRPFLLMISRLERVKHPEDALEVLKILRDKDFDLDLVLVGEGSLRPELERQARELGVADRVVLTGDRPQSWIAAAAARATATLSPLTGRALIEALLGGRPVVAYDFEWQSEVVVDGETGLLAPYRNRQAMASCVGRILEDPGFGSDLGRVGRLRALELVDRDVVSHRLRDAYARLIVASDAQSGDDR